MIWSVPASLRETGRRSAQELGAIKGIHNNAIIPFPLISPRHPAGADVEQRARLRPQTVPVAALHATQGGIDRAFLLALFDQHDLGLSTRSDGRELPWLQARPGNVFAIIEGHHFLTAVWCCGLDTVPGGVDYDYLEKFNLGQIT